MKNVFVQSLNTNSMNQMSLGKTLGSAALSAEFCFRCWNVVVSKFGEVISVMHKSGNICAKMKTGYATSIRKKERKTDFENNRRLALELRPENIHKMSGKSNEGDIRQSTASLSALHRCFRSFNIFLFPKTRRHLFHFIRLPKVFWYGHDYVIHKMKFPDHFFIIAEQFWTRRLAPVHKCCSTASSRKKSISWTWREVRWRTESIFASHCCWANNPGFTNF